VARPQAIVKDRGGWIRQYMPTAIGTTPLVAVTAGSGNVVVAARTPDTVDTVATTISAAAAMGARTLTVASATGITAGRRYRLGPATGEYAEDVKVRAIAGTTLTLSRPTGNPYPSGTPLVGTYAAVNVTAAEASALWFDGVASWTWASMATTPIETACECVRSAIVRTATKERVAAFYPQIYQVLAAEADWEEVLEAAFDTVLLRLGETYRVNTTRGGSSACEKPTILQLLVMAFNASGAAEEWVARWERQYEDAIREVKDNFAADRAQDGKITTTDIPRTSVRLLRTR